MTEYKTPSIFAGTKFYELMMLTMRQTQQAMIAGDYTSWVAMLRQLYNWVSGITPDKELSERLRSLQRQADKSTDLMRNRQFASMAGQSNLRKLRESIMECEEQLYANIKDLILRLENAEDEQIDWDEILSKT